MQFFKDNQPTVIAGPCMAESYELLEETTQFLKPLAEKIGFNLIFKASFDKANRSSISGYRGPGLETTMEWFKKIKANHNIPIITDIHESHQATKIAEICDIIQIPAFLCRQTDLLIAAIESGCAVNIKKGQFMAPTAMQHIVGKAKSICENKKLPMNIALTERGASFGYGDLIVDMRSFAIMEENKVPLIFDVTHSTQTPAAGAKPGTTGAMREFAPTLARAATATGCLSGYFIETHPTPAEAKSDAAAQLNFKQTETLLTQLVPLWKESRKFREIDKSFES